MTQKLLIPTPHKLLLPTSVYEQDHDSIRTFLSIIFKYKFQIVTTFLAINAIVIIVTFLMSPIYEAKSALLVRFGREYIAREELPFTNPEYPAISQEAIAMINSEIQILINPDLIEEVITTIKIENIYPELLNIKQGAKVTPLEAAILTFRDNLKADNIKKSHVIEASFMHKNPKIAAMALNILVDLFKEKHLKMYVQKSSFLEKQLNFYEQKLTESETELETFKRRTKIFSIDDQMKSLFGQRMQLDTSLKATKNHIDELQGRLYSRKDQEKQIETDKARFTQLNKLIHHEVAQDISKTVADLDSQKAKAKTVTNQLEKLDSQISELNMWENEMAGFKRKRDANEKNYNTYLEKVEAARISDEMDRQKMTNIGVIYTAKPPVKPIKPKKRLNVFLGIIMGGVAGVGFAFWRQNLTSRMSTPYEVERLLGIPVIATVFYKK